MENHLRRVLSVLRISPASMGDYSTIAHCANRLPDIVSTKRRREIALNVEDQGYASMGSRAVGGVEERGTAFTGNTRRCVFCAMVMVCVSMTKIPEDADTATLISAARIVGCGW